MFLSRKHTPQEEDQTEQKNARFRLNRKSEEEVPVDLTACLNRALHNPLKEETASDSALRGQIVGALGVLENAFFAIDRIKELAMEACHVVLKASSTDDLGNRALLAERYDDVRQAIDLTVSEIDGAAQALLGPEETPLVLETSTRTNYTIPAARLDSDPSGLNLMPPMTGFSDAEEISTILRSLDAALEKIDRISRLLMKDAQYLTAKISNS